MSTSTKIPEGYCGNDPANLADQIGNTLAAMTTGSSIMSFDDITFCEGELKLIIEALRAMPKPRKKGLRNPKRLA